MQTSDTVRSAEHPQNAATQTNGSKYEYEAYVDASGDDGFKFS